MKHDNHCIALHLHIEIGEDDSSIRWTFLKERFLKRFQMLFL